MSSPQQPLEDRLRPHQMSLQCYLGAQRDPGIPHRQYEDLEELVALFGLTAPDRPEAGPPTPGRFAFHVQAPNLVIVDDVVGVIQVMEESLASWGYPAAHIHAFSSGEAAILYARESAVGIALVDT